MITRLTLTAKGQMTLNEGRRLGAEVFASFDRKAVTLLQAQGVKAQLLD